MATILRGSDNFDTAGGNAVKAWVNFNGTGTVAIRAAFNVGSITDNGVGDYTVNFTTALPDVNYSATCDAALNGVYTLPTGVNQTFATTSYRIGVIGSWTGNAAANAAANDFTYVQLSIFR